MKKVKIILMLLICLFLSTCNDKGSNTTNTYNTTSDNTTTTTTSDNTTTTTTSSSVIIYPYSTSNGAGSYGNSVINTCYGTNSSGYTSAPFFSTSTHDLKDRLPSSKWSYPVKSLQGRTISSSWENLWDGNIDMSLHEAEMMYEDNTSTSNFRGFWKGTKSDGTFSGNNCRDWTFGTNTDNATWGNFLAKDNSTWIDNGILGCDYSRKFLCFMYN